MNNRPCKNNHSFDLPIFDFGSEEIKCTQCPITITRLDMASCKSKNDFTNRIREKVRDWYIKELES